MGGSGSVVRKNTVQDAPRDQGESDRTSGPAADALTMMIIRENARGKLTQETHRERRIQSLEAARKMSQQIKMAHATPSKRGFFEPSSPPILDSRKGLAPILESAVLSFGFIPRQIIAPPRLQTEILALTEDNLRKLDEYHRIHSTDVEAYQRMRVYQLEYINESTDPTPIVWTEPTSTNERSRVPSIGPVAISPMHASTASIARTSSLYSSQEGTHPLQSTLHRMNLPATRPMAPLPGIGLAKADSFSFSRAALPPLADNKTRPRTPEMASSQNSQLASN